MNAPEKLRALIDGLNKRKAAGPVTGGDGRMQSEALNTSAMARNMAMDRYKLGSASEVKKTLPLAQLVRK